MLKFICRGVFFCSIFGALYHLAAFASQDSQDLLLEPITVTGANHPYNTYSLKSGVLNELASDSVVDSLVSLPVDLQSRTLKSGIQTDFSLRGSTFQGVLMLLDGRRINDPQTAHFNSDIPLTKEDLLRIDSLSPVDSLSQGADAIGGALNFVTKPVKKQKITAELSAGDNHTNSGVFSVSLYKEGAGLRVSVEKEKSSGFRYDTDFDKLTVSSRCDIDTVNQNKIKVGFGYQEKEFGAFDFYTPGMNFPSREWTRTWLIDSEFTGHYNGFDLKPYFLWRKHFDKFMLDETQIRSKYVNYHTTYMYTPGVRFEKYTDLFGKTGIGAEYLRENIISSNLGKHMRQREGFYIDDVKEIGENLNCDSSLRLDNFTDFGLDYTGALSLKYKLLPDNYLYIGSSRNIRVPSFTELYYSDPTTVGNPDLKQEASFTCQGGYEYKNGKNGFAFGLFFRRENDFIDWVKSSPLDLRWEAENITDAAALGLETTLNLGFRDLFSFNSNYVYTDKIIEDNSFLYKYGPNYSRHLVNSTLIARIHKDFTQSFTFVYKKQPARGGYFLMNTYSSWELYAGTKMFLKVDNLFDRPYEDIPGVPQAGRSFEAGLRFEW